MQHNGGKMNNLENQIVKPYPAWRMDTGAQQIDFVVTEDCNLRCKYCYICKKQTNHVLDFESAKKFIDYLFSGELELPPAVILGFIGGEPFLEIELIDKITDYFKFKAYEVESPWYWNYCISITTNGINYDSPKVQKYIRKNKDKMSLTITVDGTREKHDLQRVFPNGEGSYDAVARNIPLYLEQFAPTTKVTCAHADIGMLYESIRHLFKIGITMISANVVFEDVWEDGDDKIFEEQLIRLADYMIDTESYKSCSVSLFDELIGAPFNEEGKKASVCGAGLMLAVGPTGKIYPCLRYKDYSLDNHEEIVIGSVDEGIDYEKVIRFRFSTNELLYDEECINCEVATGCSHCQAHNYDSADTATNFQRSKAICLMHKARVRANNYYFNRLYNEKGIEKSNYLNEYKKMYFALADDFVPFCEQENSDIGKAKEIISPETLKSALNYAAYNFYSPVFVHSYSTLNLDYFREHTGHRILHIVPAKFYEQIKFFKNYILVLDCKTINMSIDKQDMCILNVHWNDIQNLSYYVKKLFNIAERINLNLLGSASSDDDLKVYAEQLEIISRLIYEHWVKDDMLEFNKITDVFFDKMQEACVAGERNVAVAPDGKYYICPISYIVGSEPIGSVQKEQIVVKNRKLYSYDYAPLCNTCPATQCVRCAITNIKGSGEVNIPPINKCKLSIIEYNISSKLRNDLVETKKFELENMEEYQYETPFKCYEETHNLSVGYRMKKFTHSEKR